MIIPVVTEIVRVIADYGVDTFGMDEGIFLDRATIAWEREVYEESIDGIGMADCRYL